MCGGKVSQSVSATIAETPPIGWDINNKHLFFTILEVRKSKIMCSVSGEGPLPH